MKKRICSKCQFTGTENLFCKGSNICRECNKKYQKQQRLEKGDKLNAKRRAEYGKTKEQKVEERNIKLISDRKCNTCFNIQSFDCFVGGRRKCKACQSIEAAAIQKNNKNKLPNFNLCDSTFTEKQDNSNILKTCKTCLQDKTYSEFHARKHKLGLWHYTPSCIGCTRNNRRQNYVKKTGRTSKIKPGKSFKTFGDTKICTGKISCNISKNIDEFYSIKKEDGRIYYTPNCKRCRIDSEEDNRGIYKIKNKEKINKTRTARAKARRLTDFNFKLKSNVSSLIRHYLKNNGSSKNGKSCIKYLDYTIIDMIIYIQSLFSHPDNLTPDGKVWMNCDNNGAYNLYTWDDDDPTTWTWQLDHIIPQSDLPYTSMEDDNFKKCWSLENLRPYSAKQNVLDGANRTRHTKGIK